MTPASPTPSQSQGRLPLRSRVAAYLGLTNPQRSETFSPSLTYNGVPVQSLADLYAAAGVSSERPYVSRDQANTLPAVVGTRTRIQATISNMPLIQRRSNGIIVRNDWLTQPNPNRPRINELADTVADMYYEGIAYWRVLKRGPSTAGVPGVGFPLETEWVAYHRVTPEPDGGWRLDGREKLGPGEIIAFQGLHKGILHEGATGAIQDARRLAAIAAIFTNSPFPMGYFQAMPGEVEPDDEEYDEMIGNWERARKRRGWGRIPQGIELHSPDWDPAKLQLNEARDSTKVDLAVGTGANPEDVGVSTTSRTYFNAAQVRKDSLDFQITQYTGPIQERLSMPDCTPRGSLVEFSPDKFLSLDEQTNTEIVVAQMTAGVIDADEGRAKLGYGPFTTAQRAEQERKAQRAAASPAAPAPTSSRR